jgi:hypothetical protein
LDIQKINSGKSVSPFARSAQRYIDNGLPVIPIAPGTKMPGEYAGNRWRGMNDWRRYSMRLPTELELDLWQAWPDAGLGLLLGPLSGIIAVDVDTDDSYVLQKLNKIIPPSPVRKRGKKGYTSFFRFNGEVNKSWRINGKPVMDLLCEGRQTLMPGTIHPDGPTYHWLTEDTLDTFDIGQLPELPKNFNEQMECLVEPLMTEEDKKHLKNQEGPRDIQGEIPPMSFATSYFREINTQALYRLDEWVPKMIPTAKAGASGYRCKAFWRNAENLNVGISRTGIRDFGGDYGMTPIDLVMHAQNVTFQQAADALRQVLNISLGEEPSFQIGKKEDNPKLAPKSEGNGPKPDADPMLVAREAVLAEAENVRKKLEKKNAVPDFILQAPGMLGRIAGWMAETAPKYQPELFVASALALMATVMGRLYRTEWGNWPSLYIVMVAKTGEGKEHPQQAVMKFLAATGLEKLVVGSGYTSPGAVHTALMLAPSHIAIIDEMGKLIKFSRMQGSANSEAAIDKLTEAYTKSDAFMKPQMYSMMNLSGAQRTQTADKTVHNPAITLLGATTPGTFYESLTKDLIADGFLGRNIVVQSSQSRQTTRMKKKTPPDADIVEFLRAVHDEGAGELLTYMNPSIPAAPVTMTFDDDAKALFEELDFKLTYETKPQLEADGLDGLLARTVEKALRVSMLTAKATNKAGDNVIYAPAAKWAIDYVYYNDMRTIDSMQVERSETLIEREIKKAVGFVARAKTLSDKDPIPSKVLAHGAMPRAKLMRNMKLSKTRFNEVIETAIEQGMLHKQQGLPEVGYAGEVYWAVDQS